MKSMLPEYLSSENNKEYLLYAVWNSNKYSFIFLWVIDQLFSGFKIQSFQVLLQIRYHTLKFGSRVGKFSEEHSLQNVSFTDLLFYKP